MKVLLLACTLAITSATTFAQQTENPQNRLSNDHWELRYDERGVHFWGSPDGPMHANLLSDSPEAEVRFQINGGEWQSVFKRLGGFYRPLSEEYTYSRRHTADGNRIRFVDHQSGMPFALQQTYTLNGNTLEWDLTVTNKMHYEVTIGDISINIPTSGAAGPTQKGLFEGGFIRKAYISGDSSFLLFTRRSGKAPYLLLTVKPGTHLEYFEGSEYFVHSGYSGNAVSGGSWRQPHTYNRLTPTGQDGERLRYGFKLQWAHSYEELRHLLYDNGLIDIRVVPGMTVPRGLEARFSLHTKTRIDSVVAEFPGQTEIEYLGERQPDHHIYRAVFDRLGENKLTVFFDDTRKTYLEFFSTQPVETLLAKRREFIVENQQHRNPDLWYDGLFSIWDMKHEVLRGPDNLDGWSGWWEYLVAADDPVLGIAPFLASVNALNPDPRQIEAIEYHMEHFVWGGLQRSDRERNPYGIHGVPNWKVARDTMQRARIENRRLDKMKIWRAYDYPHLFMLYYHMYQIADRYPEMVNYLDADGYLERMWQTARAFFTYPYEIYPWYDIYKWGFYNEMLLPDLISLLENKGRQEAADWLRKHWETKARYMVHDDPYPYRSEYPSDRTAFESTYALAKYAARHRMEAVDSLWYDKNVEVWRSYDRTTRQDAMQFMRDQHLAGLAVRGWLETSYYQLGADNSMSYMARMGGWSILDYGLEFAPDPHDWLQLGYASYLSSFSLLNSGTSESNYGFWFPGRANDGALGWAFVKEKQDRTWISKLENRGPWRYDGEGNLGMGAVTRTATAILSNDPLFGWIVYGGTMEHTGSGFEIRPKDGVGIRFRIVDGDRRVGAELDRDRWSRSKPIVVRADRQHITLPIENVYGDDHTTGLTLWGAGWEVLFDGKPVEGQDLGNDRYRYELPVKNDHHRLELIKS